MCRRSRGLLERLSAAQTKTQPQPLVSASNSSAGRFVARSLACAPVVLIYCTVLHFIFITSLPHFARNPWLLTASYNPLRSISPSRLQYALGIGTDQRFTSKPQSQWSAYLA